MLPIRVLTILTMMSIFIAILKLFGNVTVEESEKEYSKFKRFIIKHACSKMSRIIVFCSGYLWINYENKKISEFDSEYKYPSKVDKNI